MTGARGGSKLTGASRTPGGGDPADAGRTSASAPLVNTGPAMPDDTPPPDDRPRRKRKRDDDPDEPRARRRARDDEDDEDWEEDRPRRRRRREADYDPSMRMVAPLNTSGLAIAAGYVGLISVLCVPAPFALLLGILALQHLKKHPRLDGKSRAIFAIVMGVIFTGLLVVGGLVALFGK